MAYQKNMMKGNRYLVAVSMVFILLCGFFVVVSVDEAKAQLMGKEVLDGNMAMVTGKAPNCITIAHHGFNIPSEYVLLTRMSKIIDINGKKISIKDLKVPCVAEIKFRNYSRSADAELVKLEVKEYAQKTSTVFTIEKSFVRHPE